jgi:RNA polymerase sigma-70 factor (ECF subfamily)
MDGVVVRVLKGDRQAFAEIVQRHRHDVWRVAAAMLGERAATENLVQQTFMTAYQRLDRFERGRDLGLWLKAIARNLVREELRRSSRETRRMGHYRDYLMALCDDPSRAAERENRFRATVEACRQLLPPPALRAIELRYDEAMNIDQVAAALGRTPAATRQLLFRSREALRLCVRKRIRVDEEASGLIRLPK